MYQDSFEKARAIASKSKNRKRTSSNGNLPTSGNNYLLKKSKTENLSSISDLRRSKRKRQDSSHDLEIALKNSLLDFDGDNTLKNNCESKSQNNKNVELNNNKKRKRSLSLTLESSESSCSNNENLVPNSPMSSSSSSSSDQSSLSGEDYPEFNEKLANLNENNEESFIKFLKEFMQIRGTPIIKIPILGFKKCKSFYI